MPAVQLAQLNAQIKELCQKITRPTDFASHLHDLFESYAHWAYRPGEAVTSSATITAYHIPALVIQHLHNAVIRQSQQRPAAAIQLVDLLWQDEYLETRVLAAAILGQLDLETSSNPGEPPGIAVLSRLESWSKPGEPVQILDALFEHGTRRVRQEIPGQWQEMISIWLKSDDLAETLMGLRALGVLARDDKGTHTPFTFRVLTPLVQYPSTSLQSGLLNVFEKLAANVPTETTYFFRQQLLSAAAKGNTLRFIRRCLPLLPEASRISLRSLMPKLTDDQGDLL